EPPRARAQARRADRARARLIRPAAFAFRQFAAGCGMIPRLVVRFPWCGTHGRTGAAGLCRTSARRRAKGEGVTTDSQEGRRGAAAGLRVVRKGCVLRRLGVLVTLLVLAISVAGVGTASAATAQTIAFTSSAPATPAWLVTYAATATATSGLPVPFSIDAASTPGACALAGSTVTFTS